MPLPLILGIGAGIAGAVGVGSGIRGGLKMKDAKDTMELAKSRHERNLQKFKEQNEETCHDMDELGTYEMEILNGFKEFADAIEQIQNRPDFKTFHKEGVDIPSYDKEKIREVSVGAGILLGGITGAAVGTAGGFAAAGATTSAVMALGTASTGAAISGLSGVAATNATLAALGGGALAAGGGGMALGSMILGGATLGVGLLVGGIIFNVTGSSLSDKADTAWAEMKTAEEKINKSCLFLHDLSDLSKKYLNTLQVVDREYKRHFLRLKKTIYKDYKLDWNEFTDEEKLNTENTVLLVGLLYNMCRVSLVKKAEKENELNSINKKEAEDTMHDATKVMEQL